MSSTSNKNNTLSILLPITLCYTGRRQTTHTRKCALHVFIIKSKSLNF